MDNQYSSGVYNTTTIHIVKLYCYPIQNIILQSTEGLHLCYVMNHNKTDLLGNFGEPKHNIEWYISFNLPIRI